MAVWQLVAAGWTKDAVEHRTSGLTRLHDGVFLTSTSPSSQRQRWRAATLTAPGSVLSHTSAGVHRGILRDHDGFDVITRPGKGGRRLTGRLLVYRSRTLDGNTTTHDGIPTTTVARTVVDLAAFLDAKALRKALREALRLKLTTIQDMTTTLASHRGARGTAFLNAAVTQYARLQIERTKSDAEAYAVEYLDAAGVLPPGVNRHIAGEEADLSWPSHKLIIEIDGPQFHVLKDEDARKTAIWEKAGYTVRRITSDDVFNNPDKLLALAPQ